ncbi:MAG TPA: hypothetical protein VF741_10165, partial [Candidatus Aquilonibacter sp.]
MAAAAAMLLCAGCAGGSFSPSSTPTPTSLTFTTTTTTLSSAGGTVAIPEVSSINTSFAFGAGGPSGDTLTITGSTTAPANAPQPQSANRKSTTGATLPAQAGTALPKGYYYATLSVGEATDASLITSMTTSGEVPLGAQQVGTELDDIT